MGWIKQSIDGNLPKWLTDNLPNKCQCGGDMLNFYNDAGAITSRRCGNSVCPYHMSQKIVSMCEILGVKGIGPATALNMVQSHGLQNQYQAIPYILAEKPVVPLLDFLRMAFVKGIDKGWSEVTATCSTLEDCFTKYTGNLRQTLLDNEQLLRDGAKYIGIRVPEAKQFKPLIVGTVMCSGTFRDYDKRNQLIGTLNHYSHGLLELSVSESVRKYGIMALIEEEDNKPGRKHATAKEYGIPIYTPKEFTEYIMQRLKEEIERQGLQARE